MTYYKLIVLIFIFVLAGFEKNCYANEESDNELSIAVGFVATEVSFKKKVAENYFLGPVVGFGSSRTVSIVSNSELNKGGIRDISWFGVASTFQASELLFFNAGFSYNRFSHVLDEFADGVSGQSTGFYVQPEIGSESLRIGTKLGVYKFIENEFISGMGVQWTPLTLRFALQW